MQTLSADEVLQIHGVLARDFEETSDPISPPGLRDRALLESAIHRQLVGHGGQLKHFRPDSNAATLLYGVCSNHPFHNGNKRTALVSMLVHLDKNGLTLTGTKQDDLFKMILTVAQHELVGGQIRRLRKKRPAGNQRPSADEEVDAIAAWIRARSVKPRRGERQVTFRQLRKILRSFDFDLRHISGKGNSIDVVSIETVPAGLLRRGTKEVVKRIGSIGYRDEGTFVSLKDLKRVREMCRLREEDGTHSSGFYDEEAVIDSFVNRYRTVLRRLARR